MRRIKKASVVAAGAALAALTATSLLPPAADAVAGQVRDGSDTQLTPTNYNAPARQKSGPNLTVDPLNSNHIVEMHQELISEECEVNSSNDGGATWSTRTELQAPAGFPTNLPGPCSVIGHGAGNIGQRSIAFGSGSNVYATWTSSPTPGVIGYSVLLSKSTDGGATFGTATVVMAGGLAPAGNFFRPELVVEGRTPTTDRIFIGTNDARASTAVVNRSDDAGATWAGPVEASKNNPVTNPAPVWNGDNSAVATAGDAFISAGELTSPVLGPVPTGPAGGYRIVGADGAVYTFGNAGNFGSLAGQALTKPVVGSATTPSGNGYWLVASDGGIFAYGDAAFKGSTGALVLNKPVVGMASTPSGNGYWLVATDGGIFAFGDAAFFGSTGAITLNKPVVGMASTSSGNGYWLVASDGGIFNYGDAGFFGSTGAVTLNKPMVGITISPTGGGYNLVASDGGIFSFGDAAFFGSAGGTRITAPIVGLSPSNKDGRRPLYIGWVAPKGSGACPPSCEQLGENSTDSYIVVAKSTDMGQTWTRNRAINVEGFISPAGTMFNGSNFPRLATGPGGEVYLTFNQGPGVFGSNDCGTGPFPLGAPGAGGAIACPSYGPSGFKRADHFMNWDMDPWFLRSTNGGATWGNLRQLNEPKQSGLAVAEVTQTRHPEIVVAPNGRIDIAWEDRRHWYLNTSDRKGAVTPAGSNLDNYACVHSHSNCSDPRLGDTYMAQSSDAGVTFGLNRRVNDRSHNNDVGSDYRFSAYWDYGPAIANMGNDQLLVADMDSRLGNPDNDSLDIFLRKVDMNAPSAIPSTNMVTGTAPDVSVALSQRTQPGGGEGVHGTGFTSRPWTRPVIVNQDDVSSALVGGVLARANVGPLLASPTGGLPANVKAEVTRVAPVGAFIIGDLTVMSAQIVTDLVAAGVPAAQIVRISGPTAADTAAQVALNLDRRRASDKSPAALQPIPAFDAVIIANPTSASASAASALAVNRRLPILYSDQNTLPAVTLATMATLNVSKAIIVGSTGVISNRVLKAPARTLNDGAVTAASATLTSASGAFTDGDVGRGISNANIPAGTTITAVASATSVTLSANATAAVTGGTFVIAARTVGLDSTSTRLGGADQYGTSNAVVTESLARGLPRNMVYVADGNRPMHAALVGWAAGRMGGLLTLSVGGAAAPAETTLSAPPYNLRPYIDRIMTSGLTGTAVLANDPADVTP